MGSDETAVWPDTTVTKLDTARSQFETAILLWFEERDPISINTLVAAAHHVCNDLTKGGSPMILNRDFVRPEKWREYQSFVCALENFSKHADQPGERDPYCTITFKAPLTEVYLLDGLELFHRLNGSLTPLMQIFRYRFSILNPQYFSNPPLAVFDQSLVIEWSKLSKKEFFERAIKGLIRFKA